MQTSYLISKKILPQKALRVHLMNKVVSVTFCDIYFNKPWEWFSDGWALTFEEGKTNFAASDMTFFILLTGLASMETLFPEILGSLGFGINLLFFFFQYIATN